MAKSIAKNAGTPAAVTVPAAEIPTSLPPTQPPAQQQPAKPEQPQTAPAQDNILSQLPPQLLQFINAGILNAIGKGQPGDAFAEAFELMTNEMLYNQIAALGADKILSMIKQLPVWNQLGPLRDRVPQFVDEFLAYGEADEGGTDDSHENHEDEPEGKTE